MGYHSHVGWGRGTPISGAQHDFDSQRPYSVIRNEFSLTDPIDLGESARSAAASHDADFSLDFDLLFQQENKELAETRDAPPYYSGADLDLACIQHQNSPSHDMNFVHPNVTWPDPGTQGIGTWLLADNMPTFVGSAAAQVSLGERRSEDFWMFQNYSPAIRQRHCNDSDFNVHENVEETVPCFSAMDRNVMQYENRPSSSQIPMERHLSSAPTRISTQRPFLTWDNSVTRGRGRGIYRPGPRSALSSRGGSVHSIHSSVSHMDNTSPMPSSPLSTTSAASRHTSHRSSSRMSRLQSSFDSLTLRDIVQKVARRRRPPTAEQAENRRLIRNSGGACEKCKSTKRQCQVSHRSAASSAVSGASGGQSSSWSMVEPQSGDR